MDDMTLIRNTTLISRPIDEVFDFAVDTRNEFKWNPKVTVTVTLSEEAGGTRLRAAFDARAHGLARLFFPVFVRIMRKEEARNMGYLKACLESGRAVQASSQP